MLRGMADSTARRFISDSLRAQLGRRTAELAAIVLSLTALALLLALASYNPADPSPDTVSPGPVTNFVGPMGADIADILLQGFGLAGTVPALVLLAWSYLLATRGRVPRPRLRVVLAAVSMPLGAMTLALALVLIPGPLVAWPVPSGVGGAAGALLAGDMSGTSHAVLTGIFGGALLLTLCCFGFALGISPGEWREGGVRAARAARASVEQSRRGAETVNTWLAPLRAAAEAMQTPPPSAVWEAAQPPHTAYPVYEDEDEESELASPFVAEAPLPVQKPAVKPEAVPKKAPPRQERLPLQDVTWNLPTLDLLYPPPPRSSMGHSEESLQANARLLESVLLEYGVQGKIVEIRPGPVVTLYELEPAPGTRAARVVGLAEDIARSLSVVAVRIAVVSGRNVIGVEIPNAKRETVYLSELLNAAAWEANNLPLALALGKDISGAPVIADLARMPHLLIAGTTGSGKSVGVNAMILSLLYRLSPEQCRLILIDPKILELSVYDGIPHLLTPVVTEPPKAVAALKWVVREMDRRYRAMSQLSVRNIAGYNERVNAARARGEVVTRRVQTGFDADTGKPVFEEQPLALEPLPFIVVFIDEMADLMITAGKEIEICVQRLAQKARAAGIHVIMATQRPSVDVITGTIKANFPTRISFQVISKFDSRTILGEQGAEQLLGQGDLLHMAGGGRITRVHGPFVSDHEVETVVAFLREQGEPAYVDDVTEPMDDEAASGVLPAGMGGAEGDDALYLQAVQIVVRERKASISYLQRCLAIGYNKAAKFIERMEKEGIVSAPNHTGKREVLAPPVRDDD